MVIVHLADYGIVHLVPAGRIRYGTSCRSYLGYGAGSLHLSFVGASPVNQHWYFASDTRYPNEFMIVTHPVPVKALKVECNCSAECALRLVPIPQIHYGLSFPSSLGVEYFFSKEVRGTKFALKSLLEPSLALTVQSNNAATAASYSGSSNQLFCGPIVSDLIVCMHL